MLNRTRPQDIHIVGFYLQKAPLPHNKITVFEVKMGLPVGWTEWVVTHWRMAVSSFLTELVVKQAFTHCSLSCTSNFSALFCTETKHQCR